jgi:hypothetical protein
MQNIRPVKTQVSWMRTRDLVPPESVTRGGPVTGVTGPVVDVLFLMVVSLVGAAGAVLALAHLSIPGFFIMGLFAVVPGYLGWVRFQQVSEPAVSVGAGGVWLAGTDRRAGQAIAWSDVEELVFFTAVERRLVDTRVNRHRALGVRLRAPHPLPAEERAELVRIAGMLPTRGDLVLASVTQWEAMPYRQIGVAGRLERSALAKAAAEFAPSVRVVDGPRLSFLTPWVIGEAASPPPAVLQPFVSSGGLFPGLLSLLNATPRAAPQASAAQQPPTGPTAPAWPPAPTQGPGPLTYGRADAEAGQDSSEAIRRDPSL